MSKKPAIKHEYDRKKDRFEITLKRFSLKRKWLRTELIDALQGRLDDKSVRHGRHVKDPIKNTRLIPSPWGPRIEFVFREIGGLILAAFAGLMGAIAVGLGALFPTASRLDSGASTPSRHRPQQNTTELDMRVTSTSCAAIGHAPHFGQRSNNLSGSIGTIKSWLLASTMQRR
jgi:hypothetical protein